jgi:hypothetical protein
VDDIYPGGVAYLYIYEKDDTSNVIIGNGYPIVNGENYPVSEGETVDINPLIKKGGDYVIEIRQRIDSLGIDETLATQEFTYHGSITINANNITTSE